MTHEQERTKEEVRWPCNNHCRALLASGCMVSGGWFVAIDLKRPLQGISRRATERGSVERDSDKL